MFDLGDIVQNYREADPKRIFGTTVTASQTVEVFNKRGDIHRLGDRTVLADTGTKKRDIDVSWLKSASETYNISPDINDYVITEIPSVTVDFPNRNLQAFPFEEVTFFDPMFGKLIYQTFMGKPTHIDHKNQNPLDAKGVHFDAHLEYVPKWKVWKIVTLAGWDRTKDKKLASDILERRRRGYSMGALVSQFVCPICGQIETSHQPCEHMRAGKGSAFDNNLVYQLCVGVNFFEQSSVEDPADSTAWSDAVYE